VSRWPGTAQAASTGGTITKKETSDDKSTISVSYNLKSSAKRHKSDYATNISGTKKPLQQYPTQIIWKILGYFTNYTSIKHEGKTFEFFELSPKTLPN